MNQLFKKDDIIKLFEVINNKVKATIELDGYKVTNPTVEQFLSIGWEKYDQPEVEPVPYVPTLEELVENKIRERYSINQEFEVQRRRFREPEAFEEYDNFVEQCIAEAEEELKKYGR